VDVVLPEVTLLKVDLTYPEHPIKVLDIVSQGTRRSSSIKCNGVIILKKMQHGKAMTSSVCDIQTLCYHSEGMCDYSLSLLEPFSLKISGRDFFLGERVVTPLVSL
jgi:hypothetical protein